MTYALKQRVKNLKQIEIVDIVVNENTIYE